MMQKGDFIDRPMHVHVRIPRVGGASAGWDERPDLGRLTSGDFRV